MFSDDQLQHLYRYAVALTSDETAAYDLLQDGLEAYLRTPPYNSDAKELYIKRIIRNRFIDQLRHSRKFPEDEFDENHVTLDINTHNLEQIIITQDELAHIWQLLSTQEREILYLWALDNYSCNEISQIIQLPRGTVLAKLHRLRKRINDHIKHGQQAVEGKP